MGYKYKPDREDYLVMGFFGVMAVLIAIALIHGVATGGL